MSVFFLQQCTVDFNSVYELKTLGLPLLYGVHKDRTVDIEIVPHSTFQPGTFTHLVAVDLMTVS